MSAGLFTLSTSSSPLRAPTDSRRTIAVSTADDSEAIEAAEAISAQKRMPEVRYHLGFTAEIRCTYASGVHVKNVTRGGTEHIIFALSQSWEACPYPLNVGVGVNVGEDVGEVCGVVVDLPLLAPAPIRRQELLDVMH